MSWARYDDAFHEHPKVAAVLDDEPAAIALHTVANTWTHRNRRGGFVPAATANRLVGRENAAAWAAVLVRHGLWDAVEGGWNFHDWGDYAPDGEQQRQAARARWGRNADASATHPNAMRNDASRAGEPVPVPVPVPKDALSGESASPARTRGQPRFVDDPAVQAYVSACEGVGVTAMPAAVGYIGAFAVDARARRAPEDEIVEAAVRCARNGTSPARADIELGKVQREKRGAKPSDNPIDRRIREFGRSVA